MSELIALMRERLSYDPQTGALTYSAKCRGRMRAGDTVGSNDRHGYRKMIFDGKTYLVHRVIWMMNSGREPAGVVDHINGNRQDNRLENLRECSIFQNAANSEAALTKAGVRGTTRLRNGRFIAQLRSKGRAYHLGSYSTREDARTAYEFASILVFKEFSPFHPARTQALKGQ